MKVLKIRRLSVNFITLDYPLQVKVGQTFLNLFKGSNKVIFCSESSFVRNDIYLLVQDSTLLFQWSVFALFQCTFVETSTSKFRLFKGDVIATVCLTTQTKHLRKSELFFEEARLSLIMWLVFYRTCSEEKICYSISSETIGRVI